MSAQDNPLIEDGAAFEVLLAQRGITVQVPADKTLLQALLDAGVEVPFSCSEGVCGTCVTKVLCGMPDHWDSYLLPEEQEKGDQIMPCCSRSKTARLTLDL